MMHWCVYDDEILISGYWIIVKFLYYVLYAFTTRETLLAINSTTSRYVSDIAKYRHSFWHIDTGAYFVKILEEVFTHLAS